MPNNTIQKSEENLCQLADYLLENRHAILSDWKLRAAGDAQLEVMDSLSRKEFFDHVPQVLDLFDEELRRHRTADGPLEPAIETHQFKRHGLSRWQQGFSITELVRDWNHLRCAILKSISSAASGRPEWMETTFVAAVNLLSELIAEGVNQSVAKFEEIRQAEARSRVIDLRNTIDDLRDLNNRQTELYRDASHDLVGHLGILSSIASVFQNRSGNEELARLYEPLSQGLGLATEILEDVKLQATLESEQAKLFIEDVDLVDCLHDTLAPYLILAKEKSISLEISGAKSLMVRTDGAKLTRIVQNLMHNALKFTTKGTLQVEWGLLSPNSDRYFVRIENQSQTAPSASAIPIGKQIVKASFADTSKETEDGSHSQTGGSPRACERPSFHTSQERSDPLTASREGLGLSIAKRLANLLGGRLDIQHVDQRKSVRALVVLPLKPTAG